MSRACAVSARTRVMTSRAGPAGPAVLPTPADRHRNPSWSSDSEVYSQPYLLYLSFFYMTRTLSPPPPRSRLAAWVPEQPADVDALPTPGDHLTHPLTRLHLAPLPLTQPVQAGGARATTVTKPMQKNQLLPPYSTGILKHLGRGLQLI